MLQGAEEMRAAAELRRKRGTDSFVHAGGGWVDYHGTRVVEFDDKMIQLNAGGWKTVTTRRRMNQASDAFCLGIYVYQKAFIWYVDFGAKTYVFDRMQLTLRRKS